MVFSLGLSSVVFLPVLNHFFNQYLLHNRSLSCYLSQETLDSRGRPPCRFHLNSLGQYSVWIQPITLILNIYTVHSTHCTLFSGS